MIALKGEISPYLLRDRGGREVSVPLISTANLHNRVILGSEFKLTESLKGMEVTLGSKHHPNSRKVELPVSQVGVLLRKGEVQITIPHWLAKKKGL